ncbi:MAG: hypothetical protein ABI333_15705 [bacterium]
MLVTRTSAALLLLLVPSSAQGLEVGEKAREFSLKDPYGKVHTLGSFKKRIFEIWYEGKSSVSQNKWLKDRLRRLRKAGIITKKNYDSIGIANFMETAIPNAIIDIFIKIAAKKDDVTVLCDRDGAMQRLYGLRNGRSNILVFNEKRRLIWKSSGPLTRRRAKQFIRLIRRITR